MAGNNDPIFTRVGDVSSSGTTSMAPTLTAAANDYTGASANNVAVFTADSTNGGLVRGLRFKAVSTNVITVARIYVNNGSANTAAGNNSFIGEISLPATTASATAATPDIDYVFPLPGLALNPGFRIFVGLGTLVAGGWVVTPFGGKY